MSTSNDQVAHLWAQGNRANAKGSNFSCASNILYSYGTCVGMIKEGVVFLSSDTMTPSTGKQLSYAKRACSYRYFATPAFHYGVYSEPSVSACIIAAAEEMPELFKKLCRSRTYVEEGIERYTARRQEILAMAERFEVKDIPEMPEATGDLKARAKEQAEMDRQAKKERERKELERQEEQRRADAESFQRWITTGAGHCPSSYGRRWDQDGSDLLTVRGDTVITSQGAECPLAHVVKALRFYDSRKYTAVKIDGSEPETAFNEYHTNGHKIALGAFVLDEIDEQGNVRAGCHRFTAQEIQCFRTQWQEVL